MLKKHFLNQHPTNKSVVEDFNVHQKDWLNYPGAWWIDRFGEVWYNFSISDLDP